MVESHLEFRKYIKDTQSLLKEKATRLVDHLTHRCIQFKPLKITNNKEDFTGKWALLRNSQQIWAIKKKRLLKLEALIKEGFTDKVWLLRLLIETEIQLAIREENQFIELKRTLLES